jgi:hypothetical protein
MRFNRACGFDGSPDRHDIDDVPGGHYAVDFRGHNDRAT